MIYVAAWCVLVAFWFATHLLTDSQAMWISAWTGRPAYAAIQAITPTFPFLLVIWILPKNSMRGFVASHLPDFLAFCFVLLPAAAFFIKLGRRGVLREKLARELRLIACAPIPARGDKRFAKWDPDLIFPPGRWGEFPLRPAKPRKSAFQVPGWV